MAVSCPKWVQGTEPCSSTRAMHVSLLSSPHMDLWRIFDTERIATSLCEYLFIFFLNKFIQGGSQGINKNPHFQFCSPGWSRRVPFWLVLSYSFYIYLVSFSRSTPIPQFIICFVGKQDEVKHKFVNGLNLQHLVIFIHLHFLYSAKKADFVEIHVLHLVVFCIEHGN